MSGGRIQNAQDMALACPPRRMDDLDRLMPSRDAGRHTRILGILNVTPDSFHDGGRDASPEAGAARARLMMEAGADALDVGAESTRPSAEPVSEVAELDRMVPLLELLREDEIPLSVDTTKARVAERALELGATMVNDISGLQRDPEIASVCAQHNAGLILMHMRGEPRTMKSLASYQDVVEETLRFLHDAIDLAVRLGVPERNLIIDPGLGFAKTATHNLQILRRLQEFLALGRPVLVGASRKSFLAEYDSPAVADRMEATLATSALAVMGGASVLRVHDVRENRRAVLTTEAILHAPIAKPSSTPAGGTGEMAPC